MTMNMMKMILWGLMVIPSQKKKLIQLDTINYLALRRLPPLMKLKSHLEKRL